jgi:hypothetical protein
LLDTVMTAIDPSFERTAKHIGWMAALTLVVVTLSACFQAGVPIGGPLPPGTRFDSEWTRYVRLTPNKAMAVAGDVTNVYVTGYAFGYDSEPAAIDAALAACEARRTDRRIEAPCQIFAIGDRRLTTADAGTTKVR